MPAPFKRGTRLIYSPLDRKIRCKAKYVKWWGPARSALIVIELDDGRRTTMTVHVDEVQVDNEKV